VELPSLVESASGSNYDLPNTIGGSGGCPRGAAPEPDNCRLPHVFQTLVWVLSDYYGSALKDVTCVTGPQSSKLIGDWARNRPVCRGVSFGSTYRSGKVRALEGDLDLVRTDMTDHFPRQVGARSRQSIKEP